MNMEQRFCSLEPGHHTAKPRVPLARLSQGSGRTGNDHKRRDNRRKLRRPEHCPQPASCCTAYPAGALPHPAGGNTTAHTALYPLNCSNCARTERDVGRQQSALPVCLWRQGDAWQSRGELPRSRQAPGVCSQIPSAMGKARRAGATWNNTGQRHHSGDQAVSVQ